VDPTKDKILVDGKPIGAPPKVAEYILLNKPAGVMTTKSDPDGRPTVFSLVPDIPGLTYVGRLDFLTEGLLLMTTDGDLAHRLSHPSSEVERKYVVTVTGKGDEAALDMKEGVELDDGFVQPRRVTAKRLGRDRWELEITITEGKKREIRRLCTAVGLGVERLVRVKFGPIELGDLPSGQSRKLTPREKSALMAIGH
jgi:23S rRNA pseudouridine2605 synthase